MAILYVTEQGASVRHIAGRISVRRADRIIQEVPDCKLEAIIAFGNILITPGAMAYCFEQGIDISFLSSTGKYRGRLQNPLAKNAVLRQQQYARTSDETFCLANAAAIVGGKLKNMTAMLRKQRRLREANHETGRASLAALEALLPKLERASSRESLNGYEGTASASYFDVWRAALKGDWGFETRQYHPPRDPVNVLLSFGYTLLHNDLFAALNIVGLDPYLGVFHRPRQGHAALASDLIEEWRCVLIDPMVLTLLNKRILVESDFVMTSDQHIRLSNNGLKRVLAAYAKQMSEVVFYPAQGIRTNYRQILHWQARQFARVILGEEPGYRPFLVVTEDSPAVES